MAKLSALTELAVGPAPTDEIYINDGGVSKRITAAELLNPENFCAVLLPAAADELFINDGGSGKKITHDDLLFGANGTPSTQAHCDSAAIGTALDAARSDHKHAMPASGGVSLSGSTNNTVATVTGANALLGENNLTFDGTILQITAAACVIPKFIVLSVGGSTDSQICITSPACSCAGSQFRLVQGAGDGTAGNMRYSFSYNAFANYLHIRTEDSTGSCAVAADVLRVPDGQLSVDGNAAFDDNAFDKYDDALVLERAFSPSYAVGRALLKNTQEELADMGVLRRYYKRCGELCPDFLGYNDQRMAALLAGGIYQTRHLVDDLLQRVENLEAQLA